MREPLNGDPLLVTVSLGGVSVKEICCTKMSIVPIFGMNVCDLLWMYLY